MQLLLVTDHLGKHVRFAVVEAGRLKVAYLVRVRFSSTRPFTSIVSPSSRQHSDATYYSVAVLAA